MITQQELHEEILYDPQTGLFKWRKSKRGRQIFKPVGTIDSRGYSCICLNYQLHRAHRLAWLYMTGEWPSDEIDHKNGERLDNRWSNLRLATSTQNNWNAGIRSDNVSGIRGVFKVNNRWRAVIWVNKVPKHLGYYETKEEAAEAYAEAAEQHFGEFVRVA